MIPRRIDFQGMTVTFLTTENCNLRCKYCYETNKQPRSMSIDVAKKAIDDLLQGYFLTEENSKFARQGIIIEFLGGDSLVDVKLLDQILEYWSYKLLTSNSEWAECWRGRWRVSICSNGTLFAHDDVREFLEKWKDMICLTVSIDGCPEIHDMNRVFPDGRGSMPEIRKWWPWYQEKFPLESKGTKSTCARSSIPYLYESLKFMHEELGITWVNQNFIMEDTGCTEEDYEELKRQLVLCNQYVLEHRDEMYWQMVDTSFSDHKNTLSEKKSRCGSGCMLTIGIDGKVYACMRWLPVSLGPKRPDMSIGTVKKGWTNNGRQTYKRIYEGSKSHLCTKDPKCQDCEYESACAYCIAGCFTEFGDFTRTTHICEITKILCENAKVYKKMEEEADKALKEQKE